MGSVIPNFNTPPHNQIYILLLSLPHPPSYIVNFTTFVTLVTRATITALSFSAISPLAHTVSSIANSHLKVSRQPQERPVGGAPHVSRDALSP